MYFETWITTDQRKLPETIALHGNVFTQDNMANLIGVVLKNDGANVDIDGSVVGYAIRADKNTVIINGEKEGNRAWVILPEAAYAYPGPLSVVIRVVNGEDKTVIGAVSGYVTRSISGSPVDPGHVIPDITELIGMIEECEEAAGDANDAATLANTKAGLADTAATRANTAAAALEDMDATATTLTPGSSATATVSTVDGHYRVALGIPQGAKGDKGDTGDIGPTPAFSIGTVETLEPSEDATATITGTAAAPVLNLGIPKGDAGEVTQQEFDALDEDVTDLKSAVTQIGVSNNAPDLYDVSAYSSGTIVTGMAIIADSVIAANTLIHRVKLYSGVSADTDATIVIIGDETNKCIYVKKFVCKPGWNTIELNEIVNESARIGSYNSQPIFTNSATGNYIFSSNGLGRFLPADPDIGDTVTLSKSYSGNFGLPIQWETTSGELSLIDYRLTNAENKVQSYEPIVYDQHIPDMTPGYYVNSSTGELSQAEWASYSDFYKIDEITDFYAAMGNRVGCCYYTFDKRYISGFDGGLEQTEKWHQLVPPDGAAYVRFSNRSRSFPNRNVKTVNRIDHRLDNGISNICAYEYTPALYDDVSDYSGGTILSGIGVVPDAIITSGVMINSVRIYSGVSEQTNAKIVIIGNTSGKCLKSIDFACNSGWNTVTVNDSFAEGVRVGIYNASPLYVTGATGSYVFSSGGLGRFLPVDITIGDNATIRKEYSGDFALSVQVETSAGELPNVEYRLGEQINDTENAACNILPMYDTFICIGDSLTFSQVFIATGTTEGTNRQAYKTYPQVLASLCGGVSYNYATPGDTGVSWWQRSSSGAFDHHGLYIVFLGTNEGFTDTIDTDCPGSDPDDFDKTTNTGAYGAILQTIKNNGDKAVLITPWGGGGSSLATTKVVINKFSVKYGFPVIDVDVPERTASVYHLYPDGTGKNLLHFNDLGYAWLANEVKKQINLLDYADKFKIMRTQ